MTAPDECAGGRCYIANDAVMLCRWHEEQQREDAPPPSPAVANGASAFPPVGDVVTQPQVVGHEHRYPMPSGVFQPCECGDTFEAALDRAAGDKSTMSVNPGGSSIARATEPLADGRPEATAEPTRDEGKSPSRQDSHWTCDCPACSGVRDALINHIESFDVVDGETAADLADYLCSELSGLSISRRCAATGPDDARQARLHNHYGYCTLSPDHDGPCGPAAGGAS